MNNNKMKFWLIIPVCAIVLLLGGTYAWYVWQTTQDEETIIATDTGYAQVFFDGGSDITGKLKPVSDKSKGMAKKIIVVADKQFIEPISFNLYLDINKIDAGLKHESFKFELYKDGIKIKAGNFSEAFLTENLKVCEKNTGATHIILTSDTVTTTESVYTLYTWIDGNMNNPLSMESQDFDFTLHADGQHAILGEIPTIPEGATYIRGAIPGTPNNHDMTNAIVYSAGDHFPASVQKGDIYQYGDYEYVYGYYLENTTLGLNSVPSGISYNTNGTYASQLARTNEHRHIENDQYDTQFIVLETYVNRVAWISAEGHFEDSDGWGIALKSYGFSPVYNINEVLPIINGANVINMTGTFSDALADISVTGSIAIIPETIKYMNYTFNTWSICGYGTEILRINSEQVSRIEEIFSENYSYPPTIEVPEGSTTYETFMTAKANGEIPEGITITTFVKE